MRAKDKLSNTRSSPLKPPQTDRLAPAHGRGIRRRRRNRQRNDLGRTAVQGLADHRSMAEPQIVDHLVVQGWPYQVRAGGLASPRAQAAAALERFVALGLPHA